MEYILLLIILGLLISLINKTSSNYNLLKNEINDLQKKISELKKVKLQEEKSSPITRNIQVTDTIPVEPTPVIEDIPEPTIKIKQEIEIVSDKILTPKLENIEEKSTVNFREDPMISKKSIWKKFKERNPDLEKFIGENLIN